MAIADVISYHTIDLANDANYCYDVAPQGDGRSRYAEITLVNSGFICTIPNECTIVLAGTNAGGFSIFNQCSLVTDGTDGRIRVPMSNGVLSFPGLGKYRIEIYEKTNVTSFSFNIFVTECPYDVIKLKATDHYEALTELIKIAQKNNRWIVGYGTPADTIGKYSNDYYLDSENGDIWIYNRDEDSEIGSWGKTDYNLRGTNAGFAIPTSNISESTGVPSVEVTTTSESPNWAKEFNFNFKVRGAKWFAGTDINHEFGSKDYTKYKSSNSIVGDMYVNTETGIYYRCTNVTSAKSTWEYALDLKQGYLDLTTFQSTVVLDSVKKADTLVDTIRGTTNVSSDATTATIVLTDNMFKTDGNFYYKTYTSVQSIPVKSCNSIIDKSTGVCTVTIEFTSSHAECVVAVDIIKR